MYRYGSMVRRLTDYAAIILPYYGRLRSCRFGDTIRYILIKIVLASEGDPGS